MGIHRSGKDWVHRVEVGELAVGGIYGGKVLSDRAVCR